MMAADTINEQIAWLKREAERQRTREVALFCIGAAAGMRWAMEEELRRTYPEQTP